MLTNDNADTPNVGQIQCCSPATKGSKKNQASHNTLPEPNRSKHRSVTDGCGDACLKSAALEPSSVTPFPKQRELYASEL